MKFNSVFDIIGPVMIGPSSSHTAGAVRIGRMARQLFNDKPDLVNIILYESFAKTYHGHGTDLALVGGLLDLDTDDQRIRESLQLAQEQGIKVTIIPSEEGADHPNTVRISMKKGEGTPLEVVGVSLGGGKVELIEIDGFPLHLSGDWPALLIFHEDRFGVIASVTQVLKRSKINIGFMEMSRKGKGSQALMLLETDQPIPTSVLTKVKSIENVHRILSLNSHPAEKKGGRK